MNHFFVSLTLLFGAFAAKASPPEFAAMEFNYDCSFEVQIFENGKGTFNNYEKQFSLKNLADPQLLLFSFSSSSQPWTHFCENCSGAKEIYQGQKFTSPVEVKLKISPESFGTVTANLMYVAGGYIFDTDVALLSAPLSNEIDHAFPEVKTSGQRLKSHLYCRLETRDKSSVLANQW